VLALILIARVVVARPNMLQRFCLSSASRIGFVLGILGLYRIECFTDWLKETSGIIGMALVSGFCSLMEYFHTEVDADVEDGQGRAGNDLGLGANVASDPIGNTAEKGADSTPATHQQNP
jgi:hypothetical protein